MRSFAEKAVLLVLNVVFYYITVKTPFGSSVLNPNKVIERKYIMDNGKANGFYSELTALNRLGLSIQIPNTIEICTNSERTKLRTVKVGSLDLAVRIAEHSRHIYDIYKLLSVVEINDELKALAVSVADERRPHSRSLSVQEGVSVKNVLREIIDNRVYEDDYNTITSALLFEPVSYGKAVEALNIIVSSGLFD